MKETPRAAQAWADYLALGPERSLEKLAAFYQTRTKPVPVSTLKLWSTHFDWQGRLKDIAEREAKAAEEREAAYRRSIMEEGYGLAHERVKALKTLAGKLFDELTTEEAAPANLWTANAYDDGQPVQTRNRLWVRDVKQIGSGEGAQRVDIERFNGTEVEQFRGLLDDIAKEVGDRKQRTHTELTGKDGGPIAHEVTDGLSDVQHARRLAAFFDLFAAGTPDVTGEPPSDLEAPTRAPDAGLGK